MKALFEAVYDQNMELFRRGLIIYTWGNVSGIDRERGIVVIKPSGVPYESMRADDMVAVDMEGNVIGGGLRPSSDLPTHLAIYRAFENVGGVVHTHSRHATAFAQAGLQLPAFGTTHADYFRGAVPITRALTQAEIEGDYEANTGRVIIEAFAGKDPMHTPGALVKKHGPFTWGSDAANAVHNAVVLEEIAAMAWITLAVNPQASPAPQYLLDKHFERKHGANAYYGQAL